MKLPAQPVWSVALALLVLGPQIELGESRLVAAEARVGQHIESFSSPDVHGQMLSLADFSDQKLIVVAFLGNECPVVKLYAPRLQQLADQFADQGVAVVGVNSNSQDTITETVQFARAHGVKFTLLKDRDQQLADLFGAERTPEVFVLDQDRVIRYRGRIDDQYAPGVQRREVREASLRQAIEQLLAGQPVSQPVTEAPGCYIGRSHRPAPSGEITFSSHVAKIIQTRCLECHRQGELAPFSLEQYDDVVAWSDTIREVVSENRMPPWFADPRWGKFTNDCSLSAEEREQLFSWIDHGCPAGDLAQVPAAPEFAEGWRGGEPDQVLYMAEQPFSVPAEGVVDYQHFVADPGFTEDKWVQVCEARPGNPSVVHHIVVFIQPPGKDAGFLGPQLFGDKLAAVYAPGTPPWSSPPGTAVRVPAGSKFVFQMHYTPNGSPQQDRSYCGLKFADPATVKTKAESRIAMNIGIAIPPGESDYVATCKYKFRKDTMLLNLFPHMHVRGKAFRMEAEYPDGTREILLDLPRYDFAWQLRYDLVEPKLMPKGSRLICTGHFDNSEDNPNNPDPTVEVRFGEQTWEEMMVGFFTTCSPVEAEPQSASADAEPTGQSGGR